MQTCKFCNQEREQGQFYGYIDKTHGLVNDRDNCVDICAWCLFEHLKRYYPDSPAYWSVGEAWGLAERGARQLEMFEATDANIR